MVHPQLSVFNDIHIGTVRSAGTTPSSALRLRDYLLENFRSLMEATDNDVLINGDLFDKEFISLHDLLATIDILRGWLTKGHRLWLAPGNHDLSKTSSTLSSFQFLAKFLGSVSNNVRYIADLEEIYPGYWVLPHLPNQDLLDDRLARVPECHALFVHTNYDNGFAAQTDHSLNISRAQAEACKATYIVFGHEHQTRTMLGGKVLVPGNQVPSSVADCLNCLDSKKYHVRFMAGVPQYLEVMELPFEQLDWQNLRPSDALFIRITGDATPAQGSEVTQAITRYRAASSALVITNAVAMGRDEDGAQQFADSLENVTAFDVMAALRELLSPEEIKAIEELPA